MSQPSENLASKQSKGDTIRGAQIQAVAVYMYVCIYTRNVLYKHSNGERASLANLKLTIGSFLACS